MNTRPVHSFLLPALKQEENHKKGPRGSWARNQMGNPSSIFFLFAGLIALQARGGVVFTNLASFDGTNGAVPYAALVQGNDGNFYGTASSGGTNSSVSIGTIFKMTSGGAITGLYSFHDNSDGSIPYAPLVQGKDGNFYGTTYDGGSTEDGTVFRIKTNGVFTNLYSFPNNNGHPYAALVQGADGDFYGTTYGFGGFSGIVFRITTNGVFTNLFSLANIAGGGQSRGALIQESNGNFYGTAYFGGGEIGGYGAIFEFTTNGMLTHYDPLPPGNDGQNSAGPENPWAGLIKAADGNFYGTSEYGGPSDKGTIFSYSKLYQPLHTFGVISNGIFPCGGLVQGRDGNFYGTTYQGGITNASAFYGWGTVFQVATNGTLTTLFSFNGTNGGNPYASLVLGSDGDFYGTTSTGGKYGKGTIFRLSIPMPPMFQSINKTNGAIAFTWSAVAGQSYQLQYKTNLIQANWLGLGGSMIATNSPMSSTDSTPTNSQRLYRVVLQ